MTDKKKSCPRPTDPEVLNASTYRLICDLMDEVDEARAELRRLDDDGPAGYVRDKLHHCTEFARELYHRHMSPPWSGR